jgi:hypothetical protein
MILLVLSGTVTATVYYAGPSGTGTACSQVKPCSLGTLNAKLQASDTGVLTGGNYLAVLDPDNDGTTANRITYKVAAGEKVILRGLNLNRPVIDINSDYITVDGQNKANLIIDHNGMPNDGNNIRVSGGARNVIIQNFTVSNSELKVGDQTFIEKANGNSNGGVMVEGGATDTIIQDALIEYVPGNALGRTGNGTLRTIFRRITTQVIGSHAVNIAHTNNQIAGLLVEDSILRGHKYASGDAFQFNGDFGDANANKTSNRGTIIRRNKIFEYGENILDVKACKYVVFEDNKFYWSFGDGSSGYNPYIPGSSFDPGGASLTKGTGRNGGTAENIIIRNNIGIDNVSGADPKNGSFYFYHNVLINNQWADNPPAWTPARSYDVDATGFSTYSSGNRIINNIIGNHKYEMNIVGEPNLEIDYNLYFNTQTGAPTFYDKNTNARMHFVQWKTYLKNKVNITGHDENSATVAGPSVLFQNVPNLPIGDPDQYNFNTRKDSPARNAGRNLTFANGAGTNSTQLKVDDAGFFHDGYTVISGDTIQIGDNETRTIRTIDYNNNVLTLDRVASWANNERINLMHAGSAPDIGLLSNLVSPPSPSPPANFIVR